MEIYSYSKEDLENTLDSAKVSVLIALVKEGLIKGEVAEEWSKIYTIILRKKGFFRTLTDLWRDQEDVTGKFIMLCVKLVDEKGSWEGDEKDD